MFISTAGKSLTRTCAAVECFQRNFQRQSFRQVGISRRTKTTQKCQPPKKSGALLKVAGSALIGTTIAIVAAKNDDDFREWTRKNIPALDSIVKVIYKEEDTYPESLHRAYKGLAEGFKNVLYNMVEAIKDAKRKKKDTLEENKPNTVYKSSDSAFGIKNKQDDKDGSKVKVPESMKYLKELEDRLFKDTQEAMRAHSLVVEAMKEKTNFIDNLDQLISRHDCRNWEKLKRKIEDEKKFSDRFFEAFDKVEKSAENLRLQMSRTPDLALDVKQIAEQNINNSLGTVNKAKDKLIKDKDSQSLAKRSWDKARRSRNYFSEQLETIFPNVWLGDEKLILPLENMAPFIENVLNNIHYLEKDSHKLETILGSQIKNATEVLKDNSSETSDDLVPVFVNLETAREKRLGHEELQKALLINDAKCQETNRKSMKDLAEVYKDLKNEALVIRERDVERRMHQLLDERLAQLRADHQLEMARIVGRIQGANEAIALRGENEKNQQEKQRFWSAAQSLLSAIKPFGASDNLKEPKHLKNEIKNLEKAAPDGDELVKSLISYIPLEAVEQGVVSKECLKERFLVLEKQSRRIASLPTGSVTLVQQALALLQSILYIDLPIPQAELNNEPINIKELNNYQLLQRARYYVDLGDLAQAVRYLNLLKGPSGNLASDWIKDVIIHLESVQAAKLLLVHASASNQ